jgi:hypothetical protein
MEKELVKS